MNSIYRIDNIGELLSPSLLFFKDLIVQNLARVIEMAGSASRLRPHVKTHKCREIIAMGLAAGITKHKCATIAEAEMLAQCHVPDVMIAYPIVGPNIERLAKLMLKYPATRFSALIDHPIPARQISECMVRHHLKLDAVIDLNVGMNRTGIDIGPAADALYSQFASLPGLNPDGFHVYDGQNNMELLEERKSSVEKVLGPVLAMKSRLESQGIPVPRVVCGGTPAFPVYARMDFPGIECSPGTFILHDNGYGSKYADLSGFTPAALLLTRVISKPGGNRVTLDLGYKAVASDPPIGKRCILLDAGDYTPVLQSEEHLGIETSLASQLEPGDTLLAIPTHVCPTCAMHKQAYVIEGGKCVGTWEIASRDRVLTV